MSLVFVERQSYKMESKFILVQKSFEVHVQFFITRICQEHLEDVLYRKKCHDFQFLKKGKVSPTHVHSLSTQTHKQITFECFLRIFNIKACIANHQMEDLIDFILQ